MLIFKKNDFVQVSTYKRNSPHPNPGYMYNQKREPVDTLQPI